MSLFDRRFLLCLPLALAACGFTPVYGTGGTGSRLQNNVEVAEPETRDAYLLTRRIEERLGRASVAAYKLTLTVDTDEEDIAVDQAGDITRFNLLGSADYALIDQATGQVVTSGSVDNFTSYSATGTTVATLAAQRDAQQRLMTLLGDMIVLRLLSADLS
jgi:LPS-assembly lipoprotein